VRRVDAAHKDNVRGSVKGKPRVNKVNAGFTSRAGHEILGCRVQKFQVRSTSCASSDCSIELSPPTWLGIKVGLSVIGRSVSRQVKLPERLS